MQRWNGWGDESVHMELSPQADALLQYLIGKGTPRADCPLEQFLRKIPAPRLPEHPLITGDPKERLDHAHGQSLPDWVGMRAGAIERFPDGVSRPSTIEELREVLKFAETRHAVIIPCGGGTSVAGHLTVPEGDRPVISLSLKGLRRLKNLDSHSLIATFEAGVLGPDLEAQLRAKGFTLGHFPQSFEYASLGGWVVTRSSGQQSSHYGRIEQLFAGGDVITPKGDIYFPPFPASAAGPDLRQVLMGSEGRLGVLTQAAVRISRIPEKDEVYGIFFPSWEEAADAVRSVAGARVSFSMIRLSNPTETATNLALSGHEKQIGFLRYYLYLRGIREETGCLCLIGFTGSQSQVRASRGEAFSIFRKHKGVSAGKILGEAWKKNRFRAPYLRNTLWDLGYAADTLETAVTWDKATGAMLDIEKAISNALKHRNERVHVFTHLSHVYPSGTSIYTSYVFRIADTPEETLERWRKIKDAASRAIIRSGGTISHQHGVGEDHAPYLEAEKGVIGRDMLKQIFAHVDPEERMNPGKLVN
jgi:alkyldihydroxyacetonephosphate synthase